MFKTLRKTLVISAIAVSAQAMAALNTPAFADYPDSKPIEVIVGYSAGGGTDVLARVVGKYLEQELGNDARVVIKNQPGAGGQIGFTSVARAKADGYTLGTFNLPAAMALTYDRKAAYDANSFDYLANVVHDPNTLVVSQTSPYHSLKELIQAAKEKPGSVGMALASLGGNDHFSALLLAAAADTEFNLIPFSGASMARTALLGGHVAAGTMALSQTIGFEDELRVLAVLDDKRSSFAPDVPTAKEQGYDVEMGSYRGFVAPHGLPEKVKTRLVTAFKALADNKKLRDELAAQGNTLDIITGDDYRQLNDAQSDVARKLWESHPWK
ncbi:Bug family tripartite tricarboxylate transporter substrate binding protein [Larsenimonas rhizosphaerae]|uniref:Tripartite tricarboxylate transporter substrate binding protein n=1 Tax=Larsenimonas rhizosphaerae TaxID=2944682 RepID=A0AA41ZCS2_9GAMM|nr:tripartite tricarboxylate transporter substrate binding protein [Larsenimonas rhizosphaerae]MCX2522932.1 tripartite tricarboxylate transporter substrate binding protein [Larsenimonas rhizosphaerae]